MSRRAFVRGVGAAAAAAPAFGPRRALGARGQPGANERVAIAFVGTGGRARALMDVMPPEGRIVAICDCYEKQLRDTLSRFDNPNWNIYGDYRATFDQEKLDGAVVATADHQRILPCIHACRAGLDVYAEKPLTRYVAEECKLEILRDRYRSHPPDFVENVPPARYRGPGSAWTCCTAPHLKNWFECIKTRQRSNADVEIGHRSVTVCQLGSITREVEHTIRWDPEREVIIDDDEPS